MIEWDRYKDWLEYNNKKGKSARVSLREWNSQQILRITWGPIYSQGARATLLSPSYLILMGFKAHWTL